jgi:hypothetical protein
MLNDECNFYEDKDVKKKLLSFKKINTDTDMPPKLNIETYENKGVCCKEGCLII